MPPPNAVPLSVVMPVYNEEGAIVLAVDEVRQHVLDSCPESELVVVNDGSRDGTGPLLDEAAATRSRASRSFISRTAATARRC